MNRRNKAKPTPTAQSKQAQQAKQPVPAKATVPLAKPAPPPPKPTPSSRLRQEWQSFEIWLGARRTEKDKRVSERVSEIISPKGRFGSRLSSKPAQDRTSIDMAKFEAVLNSELAEQARTEWLRRLEVIGLNEEDWTDITAEEMQAVEAAFMPPQPEVLQDPPVLANGYSSTAYQGSSAAYADQHQWFPSPPGSWDVPSPIPPKATNGRTQQTQPSVNRGTHAPILSDVRVKAEIPSIPTPEYLYEMNMSNKSGADKSASEMHRTMSRSSNDQNGYSFSSFSSKPSASESPWEMHGSKKSAPPISKAHTNGESLWNMHAMKNAIPEQPLTPPESPWSAQAAKKNGGAALNQRNGPVAPNPAGSPWDSYIGSNYSEEPEPSPSVVSDNHSESTYVYLSPVLVELEEEDLTDIELLPEKTVEASIRQFHEMAAEADIALRKKLLNEHVDTVQHDELLEEHLRTMELRCRAVVEEWKQARQAEKERRAAEEKRKLAEAERLKKAAEAKKQTVGKGKWGAPLKADPPMTNAQTKKKQGKAAANQKSMKATVEDVTSDTEQSDTTSFARTGGTDSLETDSEDLRASTTLPARSIPANLFASMLGKNPISRSSSPAPVKRTGAEEKKKAASTTKSPLSSRSPASPDSDSSRWGGWSDTAAASGASQEQTPWEGSFGSRADEGPSLWESASREGARGAAAAWNFAMNSIAGERSATPAKSPQPEFGYSSVAGQSWMGGEDPMYRSKSRGPFPDENVSSGADPRFATWNPKEVDDPVQKMAELAFQNLVQEASVQEEESEPVELLNAVSMYAKVATVANSSKKKGPRGKR